MSPAAVPPPPPPSPLKKLAELASKVPKVPNLGDLTSKLDEKFATATNAISQALPSFPAGILGSLALGLPHSHPHPPFIPLPPLGPVILGFSVNVLIGGMPAARSGALGVSPTCCGFTPFFEVFTGSSKVFISGERAVRMTDITFHCKPTPSPPGGTICGTMGKILNGAGKAYRAASKVSNAVQKVQSTATQADQLIDNITTVATTDNGALRGAIVESMAMDVVGMIAQKVQDTIKDAMAKAMGKDPPIPPTGTPGMILLGVPTVLIGGFPMPSWSAIASGLMRMLPGKLRNRLDRIKNAWNGVACPG